MEVDVLFLVETCSYWNDMLLGNRQTEALEQLDVLWPKAVSCFNQSSLTDAELHCRLFASVACFAWMKGHASAALSWIPRIVALDATASCVVKARVKIGYGQVFYAVARFEESLEQFLEAVELLRDIPLEVLLLAQALNLGGMAARQLMRLEKALMLHTESVGLFLSCSAAPEMMALALNNIAVCEMFQGEVVQALGFHEQALDMRNACGDVRGQASSLNNLGICHRLLHHRKEAVEFLRRGLAIRLELRDVWGVAGSRVQLAAALGREDIVAAEMELREARVMFEKLGDRLGLAECFETEALLNVDQHARLVEEADKLREAIKAARPPCFQREHNSN
jgi:tetratricopeptide (TPR) repeat protein